jgi:hypothetical protein
MTPYFFIYEIAHIVPFGYNYTMSLLKKVIILLISTLLLGEQIKETTLEKKDEKSMQKQKIRCKWICNKKLYREEEIAKAISFYKNSKYYKFNSKKF